MRTLLRTLWRRPWPVVLMVATLAIGVGAVTATFTYVASFLWDSMTPDPESLLWFPYRDPAGGACRSR